MPKRNWIPQTDEEWRQLDAVRMRERERRRREDGKPPRPPFRRIVLGLLALYVFCKFLLYPFWDRQLQEFFKQQAALEHAQHDHNRD